jgi:hypothetical protein
MPGFLTPETDNTLFADFDRRLRALESVASVGLHRIRLAWNVASAVVDTFDAWYTGPAGATWEDDRGNTGTGYPQVTLRTGRKVLAIVQGYAASLAYDVAFRTYSWSLAISVDGATPPDSRADRWQSHGPTTEGNHYVTLVHPVVDLEPGEHTFYLSTKWYSANPAPATPPALSASNSAILAILPLDL